MTKIKKEITFGFLIIILGLTLSLNNKSIVIIIENSDNSDDFNDYINDFSTDLKNPLHSSGIYDPKIIDGNLNSNEWSSALYKEQFYLDADPANSDGFNYLYIDEDFYNLYLALDLCSDISNDEAGEWVGLWLNTNGTENEQQNDWPDKLNNGFESLIHDVDNNQTKPFIDSYITNYWNNYNSNNKVNPIIGTVQGNQSDLETFYDSTSYNISSEYNSTLYTTQIDFEVDLEKYFSNFGDIFVNYIHNITFFIELTNSVLINTHKFVTHYKDGTFNMSDANQTFNLYNGVAPIPEENFTVNPGNFTDNNKVNFSIIGYNTIPYTTSIEGIRMRVLYNGTTSIAAGSAKSYSSIKDYEIGWNFTTSENNATDHRIFEIKIPKTELEGYYDNTPLGIIVGGYGTLASWPNTNNWVYQRTEVTGIAEQNSSEYLNFTMPLKIDPSTTLDSSLTLVSDANNPDLDGLFNLTWNSMDFAQNYSIYMYNDLITDLNGSVIKMANQNASSPYPVNISENGDYYFGVFAQNPYDEQLSNIVKISIELNTTNDGDNNDGDGDNNDGKGDGIIPGNSPYAIFTISVFCMIYIIKKKRYKMKKCKIN